MERQTVLAKKIEAIIGLVLLSPVLVGIISFFYSLIDDGFDLRSGSWSVWSVQTDSDAVATSPTPIFYGLLAIAAVFILKDTLKFLFVKLPPK